MIVPTQGYWIGEQYTIRLHDNTQGCWIGEYELIRLYDSVQGFLLGELDYMIVPRDVG